MAVIARLTLDKLIEVRIINYSFALNQIIDSAGRPSIASSGGKLKLIIESSSSAFLSTWIACENTKKKNGLIIIHDVDDDNIYMKKIRFYDAYIVKYKEIYNWDTEYDFVEKFTLHANNIIVEGEYGPGDFRNNWPGIYKK